MININNFNCDVFTSQELSTVLKTMEETKKINTFSTSGVDLNKEMIFPCRAFGLLSVPDTMEQDD
jgi:hypothetical protein